MKDKLIVDYINKLSIRDVDDFAKKNGVTLKSQELELVHKIIKHQWRTILYGNPNPIFDELKQKTDPNTYNKIINLYSQFKNKMTNYL
ncbi:MAG: hypothetical protein PHO63_02405 [Bacilli bacterium]|nr:hypothetical protein [Bacilli bacterium]MDD4809404.1 hypothetical protein [Bacilli bacterium]